MTIFTLFLDLAVSQAFAVYNALTENNAAAKRWNSVCFKRKICSLLVYRYATSRNRVNCVAQDKKDELLDSAGNGVGKVGDTADGEEEGVHMLLENLPRPSNVQKPMDISCHLCSLRELNAKTIYSCISCRKGYHVNCYSAFHYRPTLEGQTKILVEKAINRGGKRITNVSKYAASIDHFILPVEQEHKRSQAKKRKR